MIALLRRLCALLARIGQPKKTARCRTCDIELRPVDTPYVDRCCFCGQAGGSLAGLVAPAPKGLLMRSGPQPLIQSPHLFYEAADEEGRKISITLRFDNTTRLMIGADVARDAGCLYTRILIGTGPDGWAESTPHKFAVPIGTSIVSALQLLANGLRTFEDVNSLQVTAAHPAA